MPIAIEADNGRYNISRQRSDLATLIKRMSIILTGLFITSAVGAGAYWIKDVHNKLNDGIFVRTVNYEKQINEMKQNRRESEAILRREICERLDRVEAQGDKIYDLLIEHMTREPRGTSRQIENNNGIATSREEH